VSDKSIIEKLGVTPGKDGWDEIMCEMLEALIWSSAEYELYDFKTHIYNGGNSMTQRNRIKAIEKATGRTWEEVKELLS
jgi:hypothetical protein